jgi:hypothetical protein
VSPVVNWAGQKTSIFAVFAMVSGRPETWQRNDWPQITEYQGFSEVFIVKAQRARLAIFLHKRARTPARDTDEILNNA